jgi:hypothetical protein
MTDTRAAPVNTVRPLNCPNCGGTIALRAGGSTVSLICEHCGSTLDATRPDLRLIVQANAAMHRPLIPLGTRGTLAGTAWEVVGYQERTDEEVDWSEYLLFNPYEGYAFLVDDGRRFSLGRLLAALPEYGHAGLVYRGEGFAPFGETYPVRVTFVVGEFYWRVRVGETADETDYVREGTMLACEESGPRDSRERTWTALEMQDWGVAERAFGLEPRAANDSGTPAPHEASPYRRQLRDAWLIAGLALAACLVIAVGTAFSTRVLQQQITVPVTETPQTTVLGPIIVTGAREKVKISGRAAGLDNMWVDLDYSLVNRATQRSYDAYATAEYYRGRDSDGAWSEGNAEPDTGLAAIPQGTYDLVIESAAHRWTDPRGTNTATSIFGTPDPLASGPSSVPVTVTVDRGGGFAGPFWLALLAILAWPCWVWLKHVSWNARRTASVTGDDDEDDE